MNETLQGLALLVLVFIISALGDTTHGESSCPSCTRAAGVVSIRELRWDAVSGTPAGFTGAAPRPYLTVSTGLSALKAARPLSWLLFDLWELIPGIPCEGGESVRRISRLTR